MESCDVCEQCSETAHGVKVIVRIKGTNNRDTRNQSKIPFFVFYFVFFNRLNDKTKGWNYSE